MIFNEHLPRSVQCIRSLRYLPVVGVMAHLPADMTLPALLPTPCNRPFARYAAPRRSPGQPGHPARAQGFLRLAPITECWRCQLQIILIGSTGNQDDCLSAGATPRLPPRRQQIDRASIPPCVVCWTCARFGGDTAASSVIRLVGVGCREAASVQRKALLSIAREPALHCACGWRRVYYICTLHLFWGNVGEFPSSTNGPGESLPTKRRRCTSRDA